MGLVPATSNDFPRLAVKRELIKNGPSVEPRSVTDASVRWVTCLPVGVPEIPGEMALHRFLSLILPTRPSSVPSGFLARVTREADVQAELRS